MSLVIHDRILNLEHAQRLIDQAAGLISDAVAGTSRESNVEAYLVSNVRSCAWVANPHDQSCEQLIEEMQGSAEDRCRAEWFESPEERDEYYGSGIGDL